MKGRIQLNRQNAQKGEKFYQYTAIDEYSRFVTPCKWKSIGDFKGFLAKVEDINDKWGFIEHLWGKLVIPCKWKEVRNFCNLLAAVKDDSDRWGFINSEGVLVVPCKWKWVSDFDESGFADVTDFQGKSNRINFVGQEMFDVDFFRKKNNNDL